MTEAPAGSGRPGHGPPGGFHDDGTPQETVFTYGAPALKFGVGAAEEIGHDLTQYDAHRVLLVTDEGVAAAGHADSVASAARAWGVDVVVAALAHVEPTDRSIEDAVAFAREQGPWDAFVAVGGGSVIDTAKAVNLLSTNPGAVLDYVNAPVGGGRVPEHPLRPLVAVPTTTGTGSESTTICVLDVLHQRVKSGISHPRLRPTLAVVDPRLTLTQPPEVTACSGMDIVCHAVESYTARPFGAFTAKHPQDRVPYCGANPVSDMWAELAMGLVATALRRAVYHGDDESAREHMALAATFAGLGFGNAGVHVPHANAYPLAGRARGYRPAGYPGEGPLLPHGMAVSLTAPAAFRLTFEAAPVRHVHAAELLSAGRLPDLPPAERLPAVLVSLIQDLGLPNGIGAVGFAEDDVPALVAGAFQQQRLLATAPREITEEDLARVFTDSVELW